ncbi:MAG: hypothetical protein Q4C25_02490 [Bacillota bacterium]|nr:hypothetical protein [Bacillota bacterium]
MRVEFIFDPSVIENQGHTIQDVYDVIKKNFLAKGLLCVAEENVLAFTDNGGKKDYMNMWAIITKLMNSNWFIPSATSCCWYDDDNSEAEDILSQAWKFEKRRMS